MPYDVHAPANGVDATEDTAAQAYRARLRAGARELVEESIDVPEWSMIGENAVRVRAMIGTARDAYEADIVGNKSGKDRRLNLLNLRARLVTRCMIDPSTGAFIFDYRNAADVAEVGSYNAAGLDKVFTVCQRINGLTDEDVDTLEKNS